MGETEIPADSGSMEHDHQQHADTGWNGRYAMRYHSYIIPEGSNFKDAISCTCGVSLGFQGNLSGTDGGEVYGDLSDGSEQDSTNSSSDSGWQGSRYGALSSSNVVSMTKIEIVCSGTILLNHSLMCSSVLTIV